MPLWNEIEGTTLGDDLPLRALLRSEGRTAWFATTDSDGQPAVVSVFEALNDEDAALARLQAAARVIHPNLLNIRRTGTARVEDESLVYAVMEPFDQTLAEVERDRTLAPEEAREVGESLLGALEAVEAAGLQHGHVEASGVLAVGDAIKLRSDCLTPRSANGQTDSDAAALAALLYHALNGRRLTSERDAASLPAPFAGLVRAGVGSNGSLMAMRRALNGPAVSSVSPAATYRPAPAGSNLAPVGSGLANEPLADSTRGPVAGIPRAALRDDLATRPRKRPGVAIAAVIMMAVLLFVFWYAFKRPIGHTPIPGEASPPAASTAAPSATPQPGTQPSAVNPAGQAASTMGAPATPAAEPVRRVPSATEANNAVVSAERGVWHVVAYTYNHQMAAQRKAAELAARYPQLQPQVFAPSGHAPYLVALGPGMDRKDAFARRNAARAAGMPHDTYVQNYSK